MEQALRAAVAGDLRHAEQEYRVVRPDGTVRWVRDSVVARPAADGRCRRLDGVVSDVTERKQAEAEVRASEERYRTVVENSIQGILIHTDGTLRYVNPALARMFGYDDPAVAVDIDAARAFSGARGAGVGVSHFYVLMTIASRNTNSGSLAPAVTHRYALHPK